MKSWVPLLFPLALFAVLSVLLALSSLGAAWVGMEILRFLPFLIFGIVFVLGYFFSQTRMSFLSCLFAVIVILMRDAFGSGSGFGKASAVAFWASIYVPVLCALFYHLGERGLLNVHGGFRAVIVGSGAAMIAILSRITAINEALASTRIWLFRPMAEWIPLSWAGAAAVSLSVPFLLVRRPHESPMLGRLLATCLLFVVAAITFSSRLWRPGQEAAVFFCFMSGAGLVMVWAVLESSWRSANMDELTELPGRRALKNHLARLGASYALAVVDIDHFKRINDRYGHDVGDQVLRFIAAEIRNAGIGRTYRYGGEEFVMVCETDDYDAAVSGMEKVRGAIEERKFTLRGKDRPRRRPKVDGGSSDGAVSSSPSAPNVERGRKEIQITVSIGAARRDNRRPTPLDVLGAADRALYRAKKGGRNRLIAAK